MINIKLSFNKPVQLVFNNFQKIKDESLIKITVNIFKNLQSFQPQIGVFQTITNSFQPIINNLLPSPKLEEPQQTPTQTTLNEPDQKEEELELPSLNDTAAKVDQFTKRLPEEWKLFPKNTKPDFSYEAPEVDFSGLMLSPEEKIAIEKKAMKKYKESMTNLEYSIADASLDMVGDKENNPELTETLNKFADRYLDVYKAYLEVQQEEKVPFFPADIGIAKSFGFSHNDITGLIKPAQWYQDECALLKEKIGKSKPGASESIGQGLIYYLSENNFKFNSTKKLKNSNKRIAGTKCTQKQLVQAMKDPTIAAAAKDFCAQINENKEDGDKIKDLGKKFGMFGGNIDTIEKLKKSLAAFDPNQTIDLQDPKNVIIEELKSRLGDGLKEPGYIDPSLMLDLLEDRSGDRDPIALMRHKLYFLYKSKGLANEIVASPEFVDKVNKKLEAKGWQLDKGVCDFLHDQSPKTPIFKFGTYAGENHAGLRKRTDPKDTQAQFGASDKLTWLEAERLASKVDEVSQEKLTMPFRFKMSPEEEQTYFKSVFDKYKVTKGSENFDPIDFRKYLEEAKNSEQQPWIPGKNFWKLNDSTTCDSPYVKAVEALALPQKAGISGSTDQTLTMAGVVGITSVEEIKRLRMMYLGWMTSHDDHSVDEILTATKSFGVPYTPSSDYYKQIYPENPKFVDKIAAEQERRGYSLPDHYLSNEYAKECLAELRKEKEAQQGQAVIDKLSDHSLFMKAMVAPKKAEMDDLFQKKAWSPFLNKLNTPKKVAADNGKIKYTFNPTTRTLEPHKKSETPFYTGTKKTSVSLLPSHGKILPYKSEQDESVGLLFNRTGCPFKNKYIFSADALTDNKWWRRFYTPSEIAQPNFPKKLSQAVKEIESKNGKGKKKSYNHLRMNSLDELIAKIDQVAQFGKHNEILASVKKDEIVGIFAFNKKVTENPVGSELYTKLKGISNKIAMKEKEGVDVPLFMFDQSRDKGLLLYPSEQQRQDLQAIQHNSNGEFDSLVAYLAAKSEQSEVAVAHELQNELARLEKNIDLVA